ncbi:MAG: hypothetical protein J6U91_07650 [Alistipes sp.]|nr:hypothetical protein [Alistipes sp.]
MKKLSIISRSLSKIQHKRYELYVLSRIVHLLNDPGIKFNFQQCARRDEKSGKFALIDLYLPQFNIAIEVDEAYHKGQLTADEIRQREIEANIDIKPEDVFRIDCSKGIVEVNKEIDACVNKIMAAKESAMANNQYKEWDGLSGYDHYRSTMKFSIEDDTELSSPTEICNCFGILTAAQKGGNVWLNPRDNKKYLIWWPNENCEDTTGYAAGKWYNKIYDNNTKIDETRIDGGRIQHSFGSIARCKPGQKSHYDGVLTNPRPRIVFYRKQNALNEKIYRFVGVFELVQDEIYRGGNTCIWKRNEELSKKFVLSALATINENEALESLKEELQNCLNKLDEIKHKTDIWRTRFNQGNFDTSSIECEINNLKSPNQKRNGLLTKLENLKTYIDAYKTAMQKISDDMDEDYCDNSLDSRNKILSQIDAIFEDWCKRQTNIALLKPHILTLYKIRAEKDKYNKYIKSEIIPEWIKLKTLQNSN